MDFRNKTIGFAMCGSICTLILIQFNGLPLLWMWWVQKCKIFTQSGCIGRSAGCKKACKLLLTSLSVLLFTYKYIFHACYSIFDCILIIFKIDFSAVKS